MDLLTEEPSSKRRRSNGKDAVAPTSATSGSATAGDALKAANEYSGYTLQLGVALQTVDVKDVSPNSFYERFVGRREPCVIRGHIQDPLWRGALWTDEYLKEKAGEVKVRVEHRPDASGRFGLGRERWMSFKEVVDELANGSCLYYLTTQELGHGLDGRPDVISPPITALSGDFPLRPELAGGLVVQNVNLWLGRSEKPTTTGLHHDHHDNLYILLRGTKTFRLYSPADTARMYVSGEVTQIHPNGRINYRGQRTRADGADLAAERAAAADQRRAKLEQEVATAAAAVAAGEPGAEERLAAAEERLEEALEEILAVECEREGGESDDESGCSDKESEESWGGADGGDIWPLPQDIARAAAANGAGTGGGGNDAAFGNSGGGSKSAAADEGSSAVDDNGAGGGSSGSGGSRSIGSSAIGTEADRGTNGHIHGRLPENFSQVDTSLPEAELRAKFPEFSEATGTTVELAAGDMLYLPCGWFHEVKSGGGLHMALNYWFHPPDAGIGGTADRPYSSGFWQQDWDDRIRRGALHCRTK